MVTNATCNYIITGNLSKLLIRSINTVLCYTPPPPSRRILPPFKSYCRVRLEACAASMATLAFVRKKTASPLPLSSAAFSRTPKCGEPFLALLFCHVLGPTVPHAGALSPLCCTAPLLPGIQLIPIPIPIASVAPLCRSGLWLPSTFSILLLPLAPIPDPNLVSIVLLALSLLCSFLLTLDCPPSLCPRYKYSVRSKSN